MKRCRDNEVNLRLFVDQSVYCSNQNFRMVLLAKFIDTGKRHFNVWLPKQRTILEKFKFSEIIFYDSLVCLPSLLIGLYQKFVPCNFSCLGLSQIPKRGVQLQNVLPSSNKNHALSHGQMFPKLVDYFQKQVAVFWPKQYNADLNIPPMPTAKVYKICYYNSYDPILIIAVSENKYCLNVGRRHRNNNIFFQVNINDFSYTQRCHDDFCKRYKSSNINLAPELCFSLKQERINYIRAL